MKRALFALTAVVLLALTGIACFVAGFRGGISTGRQETTQVYLDIATASLISARAPEATHQTKEYAKAQFYYYSHRSQKNIYQDLGPVDLKAVDGLEPFIRHADSPNDYYKKP
jgi:hypothetical protein